MSECPTALVLLGIYSTTVDEYFQVSDRLCTVVGQRNRFGEAKRAANAPSANAMRFYQP